MNPMSTSRLIHNIILKKLADFKDVFEYTSNYQAIFVKGSNLLTNSPYYTCKSRKIYFLITMLINIEIKYSALILAISKDQKMKKQSLQKQC